jgi:predicted O-linked N-acetylglucosamine transferase (SPINDLY family)
MPGNVFLSALQEITAGRAGLGELITAAAQLQGAGEALLAEQLYKVWIGLNPDHPQLFIARFNCSSVQQGRGDVDGAQASLEAALAQNPDFHPAYINLGGILERAGAPEAAMDQWRAVIDRLPAITATAIDHKLIAMKQIGRVLLDHQKQAPAEAVLRQALDVRADQRDVLEQFTALRLAQCEWPVVVPWDGVDHRTLMGGISPLSSAAYTDDPLLHLGAGHRYVELAVDAGGTCPDADRRDAPIELAGRRLRIGYVSSDLRDHAIGYLMAELFEVHDRSKVEVFAYYCGPDPQGALNTRILAAVEHWVDINPLDDDAAARRIAADGIDILVDVNGLTRSARTAVFARRPAPVQVNWLGFPGSMASPYHQYIIADDYIIPQGSELYYSEAVLRLPCYQPNDRKRIVVAERPTRTELGLPEDAFVFCCFNGVQKITRFTYDRWLEILRRTPNSLLWLLESSPEINERLWAYAEAHGVERGRIVFAPKQQNAYHLARYPLADLFLDTAPYGAHTTASDALWMGVPVLTLTGRGFAARVCGSLVRSAGLPELICETGEDFVERAVALGSDPPAVHALKARLEAERATCVLFDMELLAARLEDLYAHMAAEHQAGRTPQPNLVNLDAYHRAGTEEDHEAQEMRAAPDYHGLYRTKLARRHRQRPLPADGRLWDGQG